MKSINVTKSVIDLERTLFMGQAFRWVKRDAFIHGVIGQTFFKLQQSDTKIEYEAHPESNSEEILISYLGLNEKYEMPKDEHFLKVYNRCSGIRLLKQDKVETLFAFICSSNNNISRISQMVTYLSTHGQGFEFYAEFCYFFSLKILV